MYGSKLAFQLGEDVQHGEINVIVDAMFAGKTTVVLTLVPSLAFRFIGLVSRSGLSGKKKNEHREE